jgi:WD40 repeat protein
LDALSTYYGRPKEVKAMFTCWLRRIFTLISASLLLLVSAAGVGSAQAPQTVWVVPNPGLLSTSAGAVAWSPSPPDDIVATGLLDRWMRMRKASSGNQIRAILQPIRSGGVINLTFSTGGAYLAVGNQTGTGTFNVYRVLDGAFLGTLVATIDAWGILRFAPDAQLATTPAKDLRLWRTNELTVFSVTGSGYDKITTARNLSPNGNYQTAATSKGAITIQQTSDGTVLKTLTGGTRPVFSPDGSLIADWTGSPNRITVRTVPYGVPVQTFDIPGGADGGVLLRFSPDSKRVVSSGYLPFLKPDGTWDQKGVIRFWSISGGLTTTYDQETSLGVTTPVAFSPDGTQFLYGRYDGAFVVAKTPAS